MKIADCRMIAMDLDGTLLNKEKEIDPDLLLYLKGLMEQGIKLTLISGRHCSEMKRYASELGLTEENGYIVSCDGAYIMTGGGGMLYKSRLLTAQDVRNIFGNRIKHSKVCFYSAYKDYVIGNKAEIMLKRLCSVFRKETRRVYLEPGQLRGEYEEFIEKIVLRRKRKIAFDEYKKMRASNKGYNMDYLSSGEVEIRSSSTSKLKAMQFIMRQERLENKNVIVFGDEGNDIGMLSFFQNSFAMGNADERVKKSAGFITDRNDNGGIYKALKGLLKEEEEP